MSTKVWIVHAIYRTFRFFGACVGACVCDSKPFLKGHANNVTRNISIYAYDTTLYSKCDQGSDLC